MFSSTTFTDIPHVIQLAVAPVFLLTAVCTLLALIISLGIFLREIFLAVSGARSPIR